MQLKKETCIEVIKKAIKTFFKNYTLILLQNIGYFNPDFAAVAG